MPKIMVQNNCGGIVTVQLPPPVKTKPAGKGQPAAVAHPDDHTVNLGKAVDIIPGTSVIELADWLEAKKNPTVKGMLRERVPRSSAPEQEPHLMGRFKLVEGKQVADDAPLKRMTAPEALKVVRDTLDINALKSWLEKEDRDELRKAITEQMQEIEAPYTPKGHAVPAPDGQDVGGGASLDDDGGEGEGQS